MSEQNLTPKQREWLDMSRKIGPGTMTASERETLERLYAEMLPAEQQELYAYIQKEFGQDQGPSDPDQPEAGDPISVMERRVWTEPSEGLRNAFAGAQTVRRPATEENQ